MLDRKEVPQFHPVREIPLKTPEKTELSNGLPVYCINAGTQEVLKIEVWSKTGSASSYRNSVANACSKLMNEGTATRSAEDIANGFEHYGSHLETHCDKENMQVSLFTLSRFLDPSFDIFQDIILNASYPDNEVATYATKGKQQILESLEKVGTLASHEFTRHLFGTDHKFGQITQPEDLDLLTHDELTDYHQNRFVPNILRIVCSGMLPNDIIDKLEKAFGGIRYGRTTSETTEFPRGISTPNITIEKDSAVQNAIRIGRPLFNRQHPDFAGMMVLSMVLGGYFGSRLMTNVREDKGYTYGIGSSIQTFDHGGYLAISTEVGSDVTKDALKEIYFEIERLGTEPVSDNELGLVKNFMMGVQLKSVDGPFNLATKWNGLINFGMDQADFNAFINKMLGVDSKEIMRLAKKYMQLEMLMTVVAGRSEQPNA